MSWAERHPVLTLCGAVLGLATAGAVIEWAAGSWLRTGLVIWLTLAAIACMVVSGGNRDAADEWHDAMSALEGRER
jgi:hypothetical protein